MTSKFVELISPAIYILFKDGCKSDGWTYNTKGHYSVINKWCTMPFGVHHPLIHIYIIIPSFNESTKALPRYGSGNKSAYKKKHLFNIQRAITPLLTDGVQCQLACLSSYPYIYSYQFSMKSAKALPRYGSGHKSAYRKKHFFKIQRAITPLLTDSVQCYLACIILLSIYILIPSFNEIRQSTFKIWLRTQKCL